MGVVVVIVIVVFVVAVVVIFAIVVGLVVVVDFAVVLAAVDVVVVAVAGEVEVGVGKEIAPIPIRLQIRSVPPHSFYQIDTPFAFFLILPSPTSTTSLLSLHLLVFRS